MQGDLHGAHRAAYSTTIGNVAFALPDTCAAAAEIGRRGLAEMESARTDTCGVLRRIPAEGQGGQGPASIPHP